MDYVAKTQVFEGPLDLLLELVSQRKLFINDVSLAQVTDDFIKYLEVQENFPISESAEFILVASTLMLIKSRSLLPELPLTQEEEENIYELKNRLEAYAKAKELAALLKDIFGTQIIFEKEPRRNEVVFAPDSKTDTANLAQALEQLIALLPKKDTLPKVVVKKVISLEEMITKLSERISTASRMSFKDLTGHGGGKLTHEKKVSVIVGFLAMLELVKRGVIAASQAAEHGDIEIESESLTTPTYA